ncbi:MAG TPA: cytochrome c, partial [Caulobacteraceae bacterium]|nr:cytochrome c [Caulobacteraceae bacterium]
MRKTSRGRLILAGAVFAGLFGLALALSSRPSITAISAPTPASFSPDSVSRGAALAKIGDCGVCHTAADEAAYAGGVAVQTPFGAVFSSNITPDPETGIGRWSFAAFRRAMREGVDRQGARLYPALPYDHFTELTENDLSDLYAFLMT